MLQFTITISDEEEKALRNIMIDIEEWTNNAIHHRASQAIMKIIDEQTNFQAKKLPIEERLAIIRSLDIKIATNKI